MPKEITGPKAKEATQTKAKTPRKPRATKKQKMAQEAAAEVPAEKHPFANKQSAAAQHQPLELHQETQDQNNGCAEGYGGQSQAPSGQSSAHATGQVNGPPVSHYASDYGEQYLLPPGYCARQRACEAAKFAAQAGESVPQTPHRGIPSYDGNNSTPSNSGRDKDVNKSTNSIETPSVTSANAGKTPVQPVSDRAKIIDSLMKIKNDKSQTLRRQEVLLISKIVNSATNSDWVTPFKTAFPGTKRKAAESAPDEPSARRVRVDDGGSPQHTSGPTDTGSQSTVQATPARTPRKPLPGRIRDRIKLPPADPRQWSLPEMYCFSVYHGCVIANFEMGSAILEEFETKGTIFGVAAQNSSDHEALHPDVLRERVMAITERTKNHIADTVIDKIKSGELRANGVVGLTKETDPNMAMDPEIKKLLISRGATEEQLDPRRAIALQDIPGVVSRRYLPENHDPNLQVNYKERMDQVVAENMAKMKAAEAKKPTTKSKRCRAKADGSKQAASATPAQDPELAPAPAPAPDTVAETASNTDAEAAEDHEPQPPPPCTPRITTGKGAGLYRPIKEVKDGNLWLLIQSTGEWKLLGPASQADKTSLSKAKTKTASSTPENGNTVSSTRGKGKAKDAATPIDSAVDWILNKPRSAGRLTQEEKNTLEKAVEQMIEAGDTQRIQEVVAKLAHNSTPPDTELSGTETAVKESANGVQKKTTPAGGERTLSASVGAMPSAVSNGGQSAQPAGPMVNSAGGNGRFQYPPPQMMGSIGNGPGPYSNGFSPYFGASYASPNVHPGGGFSTPYQQNTFPAGQQVGFPSAHQNVFPGAMSTAFPGDLQNPFPIVQPNGLPGAQQNVFQGAQQNAFNGGEQNAFSVGQATFVTQPGLIQHLATSASAPFGLSAPGAIVTTSAPTGVSMLNTPLGEGYSVITQTAGGAVKDFDNVQSFTQTLNEDTNLAPFSTIFEPMKE